MMDCSICGAGYSESPGRLAAGANAEEFQLMGDVWKPCFKDTQTWIKTFIDFYNGSAYFADQMVVMAVVGGGN